MGVVLSKSPRVVFFGSGPVAAESLRMLSESFSIEAIVTKPTTAKEMAQIAPDTPVHAVSNRSELDSFMATKPFTSNLAILIDFGIIVSKSVIDSFSLGIINSHFSVLPEWRGADPITFAILSGQRKTGVSLMLIDEGMDTGKILATRSIPVDSKETSPSLTAKLINLSHEMLVEVTPRYWNSELNPRQQSHPDRATYSRKLTKDDGILDWTKPATILEREVRAFIEWPKSRTTIGGKEVIITAAHVVSSEPIDTKPGDVDIADQAGEFGFVTGNGTLWIDRLKPAGKNEMPAKAFLAGYKHLFSK
jgi:methionyl-tRNA formyltransferase